MGNDTCAVPGCGKPRRLREWCGMHHQRWLRTGDVQAHRPSRHDRHPDGWLWCSRCETHKEPGGFYRNRSTKTGYDGVCTDCTKKRRADQKVHRSLVAKAWREANPERVKAKRRDYQLRNRDVLAARGRAWRAANPEKVRLQIRAQNAARYARMKSAAGIASPQQIAARWAYYGGKCWMCGSPATDTEHVKPLAAGGPNWPANLRPACSTCNRSKSGTWPYPLEVARDRRTAHGQEPASRTT